MAIFSDATELAKNIEDGEITPEEALDHVIDNIEKTLPDLNFLTDTMYEQAKARAKEPLGAGIFAGVPYLLKDMHDVEGTVTGFSSRLRHYTPPAAQSSSFVKSLEGVGLNICGKTTLGEFGFLPTTESIAHGITRNPWDITYSSGGSSGGAGAAVAAGVLPIADAADGGGSIRIPASVCGLVGLKPSRGRMKYDLPSSTGTSFVVQHCLSRTVRDTANYFAAMESPASISPYETIGLVNSALNRPIKIGYHLAGLRHAPNPEVAQTVHNSLQALEGLGHNIEETDWPFSPEQFLTAFGAIWVQSVSHAVAAVKAGVGPFGLNIEDVLEPYTLQLAATAQGVPDSAFDAALQGLKQCEVDYENWFNDFDVIVSPVLLTPSVKAGTLDGTGSLEDITEKNARFADYTMVENATGGTAISLPLGQSSDGLPIGVQFSAKPGGEKLLLEIAFLMEELMPWKDRKPAIWVGA